MFDEECFPNPRDIYDCMTKFTLAPIGGMI